jgi:hypothetical protein
MAVEASERFEPAAPGSRAPRSCIQGAHINQATSRAPLIRAGFTGREGGKKAISRVVRPETCLGPLPPTLLVRSDLHVLLQDLHFM